MDEGFIKVEDQSLFPNVFSFLRPKEILEITILLAVFNRCRSRFFLLGPFLVLLLLLHHFRWVLRLRDLADKLTEFGLSLVCSGSLVGSTCSPSVNALTQCRLALGGNWLSSLVGEGLLLLWDSLAWAWSWGAVLIVLVLVLRAFDLWRSVSLPISWWLKKPIALAAWFLHSWLLLASIRMLVCTCLVPIGALSSLKIIGQVFSKTSYPLTTGKCILGFSQLSSFAALQSNLLISLC